MPVEGQNTVAAQGSGDLDELQVPYSRQDTSGAGVPQSLIPGHELGGKLNVLLGVCGSVAAIKFEELFHGLDSISNLKVVATDAAMNFIATDKGHGQFVHRNKDDWEHWAKVGDPIAHIELRRWADVLIIAPLSANTLAKMAQGLCDNLLTCIVRAWDLTRPLLVAPAMNTMMWDSPFTQRHLSELQSIMGVRIIPPVVKMLACGDLGNGAMAPVDEIVEAVKQELQSISASRKV